MSTEAAAITSGSLARWRGWRARPRAVIVFTVLLLGGITMVMPILFMLSTSFKYAHEVYDLNLIPREPTLDNYLQLFEESAFAGCMGLGRARREARVMAIFDMVGARSRR